MTPGLPNPLATRAVPVVIVQLPGADLRSLTRAIERQIDGIARLQGIALNSRTVNIEMKGMAHLGPSDYDAVLRVAVEFGVAVGSGVATPFATKALNRIIKLLFERSEIKPRMKRKAVTNSAASRVKRKTISKKTAKRK